MARLPRQLTSAYHITHYIVIVYFFWIAYPMALRPNAKNDSRSYLFGEGLFLHFGMEADVFIGMTLLVIHDLSCVSTLDEGVHRFLLDSKVLTLILTLMAGNHYFMFGLVGLYASMATLLLPPRYDGPSKVVPLSNRTFHTKIIKQVNEEKPFLVMFHRKWDPSCHFFEPQYCNLSMAYSHINFGSMDVATCSELANTLFIESANGEQQTLPVLIMFQKGQEVRRLPQVDDQGKTIICNKNKDLVINHFELDTEPSRVEYLKRSKKRN